MFRHPPVDIPTFEKDRDMTILQRGKLGRTLLALGLGSLLVLSACEKGPDRAQVAADLKSGVEAQMKKLEAASSPGALSHTAVKVTPQDGDAYLVEVEGLKVKPASRPDVLEIGTIGYLAKPKDEKTYEISDLKLAPTMPFKGPDGKEKGKLAIVTKSFNGIYSKELAGYQKVDGEFGDIVMTDDTGADVRMASFKFSGGMTDEGGGVIDTVANLTFSGFTGKEMSGGLFSIGELRLEGKYDSIKVADFQAAMQKYQAIAAKQQPAAVEQGGTATPPPPLSPEDQKAMTEAIAAIAAAMKGGDFKIALKDVKYNEGGMESFSLGSVTLGALVDGINQDKAIVNFDIGHQDLAVAELTATSNPVAQAVLPRSGNLSLKVTEIPSKDLVKVLADNLPGVISADEMVAKANAQAMLVALEAVFQSSGAKIEVAPSQLLSQLIEMKAGGNFGVSAQSAFGIVGGLDVAIRGMDELLALAQNAPGSFEAQQAINSIGMLQQYSQREQGADGKPVDKFRIELKEDGQMTVNDKPM